MKKKVLIAILSLVLLLEGAVLFGGQPIQHYIKQPASLYTDVAQHAGEAWGKHVARPIHRQRVKAEKRSLERKLLKEADKIEKQFDNVDIRFINIVPSPLSWTDAFEVALYWKTPEVPEFYIVLQTYGYDVHWGKMPSLEEYMVDRPPEARYAYQYRYWNRDKALEYKEQAKYKPGEWPRVRDAILGAERLYVQKVWREFFYEVLRAAQPYQGEFQHIEIVILGLDMPVLIMGEGGRSVWGFPVIVRQYIVVWKATGGIIEEGGYFARGPVNVIDKLVAAGKVEHQVFLDMLEDGTVQYYFPGWFISYNWMYKFNHPYRPEVFKTE